LRFQVNWVVNCLIIVLIEGINAKTEFKVNQIKSFEMISFRRTLCLFVQTYYAKHITSFSSVSIVKRGIYCYPFFEAPHKRKYQKIREKRKNKKIKKILEEKKQKKKHISWEEHIRTPRKLPKTGWRGSKYTRLENLTPYFQLMKTLLEKKYQFWGGKFKIECLKIQLKFFKV